MLMTMAQISPTESRCPPPPWLLVTREVVALPVHGRAAAVQLIMGQGMPLPSWQEHMQHAIVVEPAGSNCGCLAFPRAGNLPFNSGGLPSSSLGASWVLQFALVTTVQGSLGQLGSVGHVVSPAQPGHGGQGTRSRVAAPAHP